MVQSIKNKKLSEVVEEISTYTQEEKPMTSNNEIID
jgi:hypothetical protein